MKPYFAKYLSVEGEIKENDLLINPAGTYEYYRKSLDITGSIYNGCKKVKLFLCSRDIQVGDMVQEIFYDGTLSKMYSFGKLPNINDLVILYNGKLHHQTRIENIIKVIGEISPEATWVKEGDEFTEDEIKIILGSKVRKEFRNGEISEILLFDQKDIFTNYGINHLEEWIIQDAAERWAENESSGQNYGYTWFWNEEPPFIHHIKILGPCGHFH